MKKLLTTLFLTLTLSSAAFAAPEAFRGLKGEIAIAGGTAHIPVMTEAAKRIAEVAPDVIVTVQGGGSGVGVKQVGEGVVQIGNTGRALKAEEVEKYGLVTWPFAIDGVAMAVHPENPIQSLTSEQAKDLWSGKITNWSQVGGPDMEVHLYGREEGSGTRQTFDDLVIGKEGEVAPNLNVVASNGAMKTAIAADKGALGYVGIGHIDDSIKGLALDGAVPNQDNAASGAYKVTRQLYMNTKGQPEGLTALFIDYIYSPEGSEIIRGAGYIPLPRP